MSTERSPAFQPVQSLRRVAAVGWRPIEGKIGIILLAIVAAAIIFGPALAPYNPLAIGAGRPDQGVSASHWLGTDSLGRDVYSRLLCGGRSVVVIPLVATCIAFVIGGIAGMTAGYVGGRVDTLSARTIDVLLSIPPLLMVLVVISTAGASSVVLVIAIAAVYAPRVARVMRGAIRPIANREYVQAAQARGEGVMAIVLREALPNVTPTLFVEFASRLSWAIIFLATLNFLGFGIQPPAPNWAVMVSESRGSIAINSIATVAPAVAIGALSVAIGLIADAVTQELGLGERERTGR